MVIRPAAGTEHEILSKIAKASKAYWGYSPEAMAGWEQELTFTAESIAKQPTFLAEVDGSVAGFFQLARTDSGIELDHFWVHPDFMGRGIGRALLEHAGAQAMTLGFDRLEIDADPHAEAFYLACGARRTGQVIPAPVPGNPERCRPQLLIDLNTGAIRPVRRKSDT